MITCETFYNALKKHEVDLFAGDPRFIAQKPVRLSRQPLRTTRTYYDDQRGERCGLGCGVSPGNRPNGLFTCKIQAWEIAADH
ncbi:hypothetical protein C4565_09270 [Candidatus Parcubacteria bacterium]|nr:MAG: hypothetical protein C4565_09270 [Candidatus Parcubacteria bacterium]